MVRTPQSPARNESSELVEGEVERITYENAETGFRVLRVRDRLNAKRTVVGRMQQIAVGTRIRALGKFENDPIHGMQLRATIVLPLAPETLKGLQRLLGSGLIAGVGPVFAERVVQHFGRMTTQVLDDTPERLAEVPGLGQKRAQAIAKAWSEQKSAREVMMFLHSHQITPALAQRILRRYGEHAIRVLQENPYRLATDIWGVGFKTADEIALSFGIAKDAPERVRAAVLHVLGRFQERGHVFVPRVALSTESVRFVDVDPGLVEQAVDEVCASNHARCESLGDFDKVIYSARLYAAESGLANYLAVRCKQRPIRLQGAQEAIGLFETKTSSVLAPAQRRAVELAAEQSVLVITGGPGVGKTTIVRAVLQLFSKARLTVALAAPTGRAARRMSESTGHEAQTIHRLLQYEPHRGGFVFTAEHPLELDALIVDECSMLDVKLAYDLISALPTKARLVLVGDVDQLPSIGPGAVLRDILESRCVPTVRLVEIFRQAAHSRIVSNAHRILEGRQPESCPKGDTQGDFFVVTASSAEDAADKIRQLVVERIPKTFGFDPIRDVQVLTPMHRGSAGSDSLNRVLQRVLNPQSQHGPSIGGVGIGDKVMQLRNDYGREVFNGDIGFVTAIDLENRKAVVNIDGRAVPYEEGQLDELVLAYACSIHKSQGSEYPAVVIPMLSSHFVLLSRNLLYTAVTRGKQLVVVITDKHALRLALDQNRREERYSWLAQRLRDKINREE